jgi:hypothetical protein
MGDMDLLENEAIKGENKSNITTFGVLFVIIAVASAVCCYLNYTFASTLAQAVFYMFICSFFADIIVFRPLFLILLSLFRFCRGKRQGYTPVAHKTEKEIQGAFNKAIKDMFDHRKKVKEEEKRNSGDQKHLVPPKTKNGPGNESADEMMNNYEYLT